MDKLERCILTKAIILNDLIEKNTQKKIFESKKLIFSLTNLI